MMNDKLNSFINSMGVLCETWTVVYKNFVAQGMDTKEALMHTQGFMAAFMNGVVNHGKEDK